MLFSNSIPGLSASVKRRMFLSMMGGGALLAGFTAKASNVFAGSSDTRSDCADHHAGIARELQRSMADPSIDVTTSNFLLKSASCDRCGTRIGPAVA